MPRPFHKLIKGNLSVGLKRKIVFESPRDRERRINLLRWPFFKMEEPLDPLDELEQLQDQIRMLKKKLEYESVGRTRAEKALRAKLVHESQGSTSMLPIGTISTCFKTRFGTPRQGSLASWSRGIIKLDSSVVGMPSLTGLDQFSHIWIVFIFHENTNMHKFAKTDDEPVKHKKVFPSFVKPPQAGGKKVGLFSTRTPHRPNPVGLSLAKITKVDLNKGLIHVSGIDLIDGTPIIDVKPYVSHVDNPDYSQDSNITSAVRTPEWVTNPKFDSVPVKFTDEALAKIEFICKEKRSKWFDVDEAESMRESISQIISLDPRGVIHGRGAFAETEEINPDVSSHLFRDQFHIDFDTCRIHFSPSSTAREILVSKIEV